jgi:hypothetical protein
MFMGLSGHNLCFSPEAFAPPVKKLDKSTPEKFKSRLKLNFSFFLSNYAIIVAMVALVIALLHPGMIAWLLFLWGLWGFHAFLISNEVIFYGKNIGTLVGPCQLFFLFESVKIERASRVICSIVSWGICARFLFLIVPMLWH